MAAGCFVILVTSIVVFIMAEVRSALRSLLRAARPQTGRTYPVASSLAARKVELFELCRDRARDAKNIDEAAEAAALRDCADMLRASRNKIALTVEWGKYDEDGNVRSEWTEGVTNQSIAHKVGLELPKTYNNEE